MFSGYYKGLLQFLFPERCRGCGALGTTFCTHCLQKIPFAANLPQYNYAVYDYGNTLVRNAIRELKYHRRSEAIRPLINEAAPHILEYIGTTLHSIQNEKIILVPVPEHRQKVASRGFNQSVVLATWWSLSIPQSKVDSILEKIVATTPQAKLSRSARLKNVSQTMRCSKNIDPQTLYIVVDDVTTTGATFTEAQRALRVAGAKKILLIALAHGYLRK
jgi:ComF family protein